MDDFFAGMGCRLRVSITDSIMMSILHSAMDKAHEKVKFKEGDIGRLNEISKFYELAIMQLEGCLKFVQEETDNYIPESGHEKMLVDLKEIRDRLQGRLKETEFAILEKDRELTERVEIELKLRQALELKESELVSHCTDLKVERTKSEDLQEFILSNRISEDENREGEFCELKNNVDQRVWNIKQKLDNERMNMRSGIRKVNQVSSTLVNLDADSGMRKKENRCSIESNEIEPCEKDNDSESELSNYSIRPEVNIGFDQMSSELESLRETLEVTFGKMQHAIFLSEVGTIEQQWRWTIEKDTISILTKGFMRDFGENFEGEMRKHEKQASLFFLSEHWTGLVNDIIILRDELEPLHDQNKVQMKSTSHREILAPSSQTSTVCKISQNARGKHLPECDSNGKSSSSFSKVEEIGHIVKPLEEHLEGDRSHLVAKMIKSHESIIQKKNEELSLVKGERLSSHGRDKDPDSPKKRIEEVIVKLNNLIKWNSRLDEFFHDCFGVHEKQNVLKKRLTLDRIEQGIIDIGTPENVEEVGNFTVSHARDEELQNEIKKLKQELEDINLQSLITEATNIILFKGFMKAFYIELYKHDAEALIREDIHRDVFMEMVSEWYKNLENSKVEAWIREEIYYAVFNEAVKDFGCIHTLTLAANQGAEADANCMEESGSTNRLFPNLEGTIREDVFAVFIVEMVKEWNKVTESFCSENLVMEDVSQIVFDETIKDIVNISNYTLNQCREVKDLGNSLCNFQFTDEFSQSIECLVKEDVCMVFFKEMIKDWKMDIDAYNIWSLNGEDIYKFVIVETMKDAYYLFSRDAEGQNQENFSEDLPSANDIPSANELYKNLEECGEVFIQKRILLLRCFDAEEDLILSASSEMKKHIAYINLGGLRCGGVDGHNLIEELLTEEEGMFSSVSSKLEKAMQQLVMSRELLSNLGSSLGIAVDDLENACYEMTPIAGTAWEVDRSLCLPTESEWIPSDSVFSTVIGFQQILVDFEHAVSEKFGINSLRLEEVKNKLDLLAELVASLSQKESLYRKAFTTRCHNLQKAEIEVDLLGDQVDVLLGLLERTYFTLDQYSPVLQQYSEVSDILKLIKNELSGPDSKIQVYNY